MQMVDPYKSTLLSTLLAHVQEIPADVKAWDCHISGLAFDSRHVKPGDLFLARIGQQVDGRRYIQEALSNGAIAVLQEASKESLAVEMMPHHNGHNVPIITIQDLSQKAGFIAHHFFHTPSLNMHMIAVTGTNGKTSICHFIASILQKSGISCGVMGTLGNGFLPTLTSGGLYTTPDCIDLHRELSALQHQGAKAIALEASSHGLVQGRLNGAHIDMGIFTNLTRDHLDYHGSMENYGAAKKQLFDMPGMKYAIINADDAFGRTLLQDLKTKMPVYGYCLNKENLSDSIPMTIAESIRATKDGLEALIYSPWGEGKLTTHCLGRFNVSNFLAVLSSLCLLGLPFEQVLAYISEQKEVRGRMEVFGGGLQPKVIVDFAHTPDALENVLQTVRQQCQGRLICVFGCGGGRDQGKRPEMGKIAEKYSDVIVVTNDNPRDEQPEKIAEAIIAGFEKAQYDIVLDRKKAIIQAVMLATINDVVVIAGKGHESYQQIGQIRIPFCDQDIVREALNEMGKDNGNNTKSGY